MNKVILVILLVTMPILSGCLVVPLVIGVAMGGAVVRDIRSEPKDNKKEVKEVKEVKIEAKIEAPKDNKKEVKEVKIEAKIEAPEVEVKTEAK